MKKLTRKLFISVLVAVFAFVALGTSTYAWITLSNTAEVDQFEATVKAGEAGIELSEDGNVWGTNLVLSETFKNTYLNKKLDDITMHYDVDGNMKFYNFKSETVNGVVTLAEETTETTAGYVEFDIQIRRTNVAAGTVDSIYVAVDGAKVKFSTSANDSAGIFEYVKKGEAAVTTDTRASNLFAINALRMSVTGNNGTTEEEKTVIYEQKVDAKGNTLGYSSEGFAHKYALNQDYVLPTVTDPITYNDPFQAESASDATQIIKLTGATAETIKIRLWIEGWDNECHAQILSQNIQVELGFKIVG